MTTEGRGLSLPEGAPWRCAHRVDTRDCDGCAADDEAFIAEVAERTRSAFRVICSDGFTRGITESTESTALAIVRLDDRCGCRPHRLEVMRDGAWYPVESETTPAITPSGASA